MAGGRPTEYKPEYCEKAHGLAAQGLTDVEIADALDIHVATYYRWRAAHPEFCESTALGKEAVDDRVEASLFHRAVGYSHEAVKIFPGGEKGPTVVPYREHYPPDTQAASLWLRNRRSDKWRDKQDHELTGKGGAALLPETDHRELAKAIVEILGTAKTETT